MRISFKYTNTIKLTNSIALGAGYTLLMSFNASVAGTYSFDAQIRLEYLIGEATRLSTILGVSLNSTYFDSECYYAVFERNP